MPTVLVTDYTFPDLDIERAALEASGYALEAHQCRTEDDLLAVVAAADAVLTQFVPVTARVIAAMARAKVIVRYGIGVDSVDLAAAKAHGIPVCNVPTFCIDEVADHTLAFILASTRQVVTHSNHVHAGNWGLAVPLAAFRTLRTLTVGIVGFGRIGREVASRLKGFGCKILVSDPVVAAADIVAAGAIPTTLDALLATSDVVTLHCPSVAATRKMIDATSLVGMKPGAILVNLARGDLVDTPALVEALRTGHLSAAALDVCDPEPIPAGHPLLAMPNVILAPHIASASVAAVRTLRESATRQVIAALRGDPLENVVNGVGPRSFANA